MLQSIRRFLSKIPLAVRIKQYIDYKYGIGIRIALKSYTEMETIDRQLYIHKIYSYWRNELKISDRTIKDWLKTALNFERYIYDVRQIKERFGSLKSKKVADIGCGWGSFLLVLSKEEAILEACDIATVHVEVAQMRVPSAKVVQSDARNLDQFETGTFDFVIEHDVFEHIGDYSSETGSIGNTYQDKLRNLIELKRILKKGGKGFISTGNYLFPYNGEVQLWLVHWMPPEYQSKYLKSLNINSDRYWLCSWEQIKRLFEDAGLRIDEVYTPPHDAKLFTDRIISLFRHEPYINAEFKSILGDLILNKPEFMPSWMIYFSKM